MSTQQLQQPTSPSSFGQRCRSPSSPRHGRAAQEERGCVRGHPHTRRKQAGDAGQGARRYASAALVPNQALTHPS
ncbi:hypothetical protein ON010_g7337 [Phytophthora cinnamomi]|nr:hypothetical protein ON010_g7337 [Phytophthora cinnamomi]